MVPSHPEQARQRAAQVCREGPLAAYLSVPFADPATDVDDLELLALDVETTGLQPGRDHVVAVGFVPVVRGRIELAGARSILVAAPVDVGQSATVHRLTDDVVAGGVPLAEALAEVLAALRGRVLLAHFARIEVGFIERACAQLLGAPFPAQVVDTLDLQRRLTAGAFGQSRRRGHCGCGPRASAIGCRSIGRTSRSSTHCRVRSSIWPRSPKCGARGPDPQAGAGLNRNVRHAAAISTTMPDARERWPPEHAVGLACAMICSSLVSRSKSRSWTRVHERPMWRAVRSRSASCWAASIWKMRCVVMSQL